MRCAGNATTDLVTARVPAFTPFHPDVSPGKPEPEIPGGCHVEMPSAASVVRVIVSDPNARDRAGSMRTACEPTLSTPTHESHVDPQPTPASADATYRTARFPDHAGTTLANVIQPAPTSRCIGGRAPGGGPQLAHALRPWLRGEALPRSALPLRRRTAPWAFFGPPAPSLAPLESEGTGISRAPRRSRGQVGARHMVVEEAPSRDLEFLICERQAELRP